MRTCGYIKSSDVRARNGPRASSDGGIIRNPPNLFVGRFKKKCLMMTNICVGCGTELDERDDDPNGDKNPVCAKCRAEDSHDFDREPKTKFDRLGRRLAD